MKPPRISDARVGDARVFRTRSTHLFRVLGTTAAAEFRLKYSGSVLGYFWSIAKPLALFTMLYFVFGRVFKLNALSPYYATSLLMGIVLFYFFSDATGLAMYSIVSRASLIRKLVFPRVVIPTSAVLTACITFLVNIAAVAVFVAVKHITPKPSWLLLGPLLLELIVFVLGISLVLSALFVRLRDIGQVWDLVVQLFFYASPIVYPVGYLPAWARQIAFLNPFTQVLQDIRALVLYPDLPQNTITVTDVYGPFGRLAPIGIAVLVFTVGLVYFEREKPWLAERV
jgi:ABC-2 type transport system permease protein